MTSFGPLSIADDKVTLGGERLSLFPAGHRILSRLVRHQFVALDELRGMTRTKESLYVHMSAIRRCLPDSVTLENEERKGYRLVFRET